MTYEERKKKLLQLAKKKRLLTPNESWIDPGSSSAHRVSLFADRLRREGLITWRDPSEWTGLNCSSASFSWFFLLGFLVVLSIKWATNRRPDLSIIAPGQCVARMPGTGPLRRSSVLARKKAIVGKSLVEADRVKRPWVVFVSYCLHALKLLLLCKLGGGQVAQGAMRPALIILDSPLLDNDPGFQQRAKHFPI